MSGTRLQGPVEARDAGNPDARFHDYVRILESPDPISGRTSQHKLDPSAPVGILVDDPARNVVLNCALMSLGVRSIVVREAQVAHLAKIGAKIPRNALGKVNREEIRALARRQPGF